MQHDTMFCRLKTSSQWHWVSPWTGEGLTRDHSTARYFIPVHFNLPHFVHLTAKKRLTHLGQLLKLNQHCIDSAFMFFKMALQLNLTRGRKSSIIDTACLYLVCRSEGTPRIPHSLQHAHILYIDKCERS